MSKVEDRWKPMAFSDLFNWQVPDGHPAKEDNKDFEDATNSYMSTFAVQIKGRADDGMNYQCCNNCGRKADAFRQVLGQDLFPDITAFAWDLSHGEAFCISCKWPYRAHHFPKKEDGTDLFGIHHLYLAYRPEFVDGKEPCPDEKTFFPHEGIQQADDAPTD